LIQAAIERGKLDQPLKDLLERYKVKA